VERKHLIGGAVMGVVLLGIIWKVKASQKQPLAKGSKILLIGDSLAVGLTPRMKARAEASGYSFFSSAVGGSRTDQWSPKMDALLAKEAPGLVLVSLGTNDATSSYPAGQASYIGDIVASTARSGADLVWIGMPTLPARIGGQAVIRALIAQMSPEVIDSRSMSFDRASDEVHSSPQGYSSWADQIWAEMLARGDVGS
jgi:lysophospholipase L1-like esterase